MNKQDLIQTIKEKAKQDQKKRRDRRFLETMGFLVAKGFLRTNFEIIPMPNKRLRVEDAVWAGENVEPRILEVLPAAVLRLGGHFDLDPIRHKELGEVVELLRKRKKEGKAFHGIPYDKVKVWADFPLRDKRVKTSAEKKVVRTFRLDPAAHERLKRLAIERKCSQTEALEKVILDS